MLFIHFFSLCFRGSIFVNIRTLSLNNFCIANESYLANEADGDITITFSVSDVNNNFKNVVYSKQVQFCFMAI